MDIITSFIYVSLNGFIFIIHYKKNIQNKLNIYYKKGYY
jgi:hypothetical protein